MSHVELEVEPWKRVCDCVYWLVAGVGVNLKVTVQIFLQVSYLDELATKFFHNLI